MKVAQEHVDAIMRLFTGNESTNYEDIAYQFLTGMETSAVMAIDGIDLDQFEDTVTKLTSYLQREELRKVEMAARNADRVQRLEALRHGVKSHAPDVTGMIEVMKNLSMLLDGKRDCSYSPMYELASKLLGFGNPASKDLQGVTYTRPVAVLVRGTLIELGESQDKRSVKQIMGLVTGHFRGRHNGTKKGSTPDMMSVWS